MGSVDKTFRIRFYIITDKANSVYGNARSVIRKHNCVIAVGDGKKCFPYFEAGIDLTP
jgi:hypothetical protein